MAKNNLQQVEEKGLSMIEAIHKGNCDRGFYDEAPKTQYERAKNEDWLAKQANLIAGEIGEAYEAFRAAKIKPDLDEVIDLRIAYIDFCGDYPMAAEEHKAAYKAAYEKYAKGTVEEELADALIRVLDHCGALGISDSGFAMLDKSKSLFMDGLPDLSIHKLFNKTMAQMLTYRDADISMGDFLYWANYDMRLNIIFICELANRFDIDLMAATEQKLAYNSTRPYKHGKKF